MSTTTSNKRYAESGCLLVSNDQQVKPLPELVYPQEEPAHCVITDCSEQTLNATSNCTEYTITCAPNYDAPAPYNDGNPYSITIVLDCGQDPNPGCCVDGDPGPTGPSGADGVDGACGLGFDWEGPWIDTTGYFAQTDVCNASTVESGGVAYICIQTHTADGAIDEPGIGSAWEDYWDLLVNSVTGGGGTGNVVWKGNWITTFQYEPLDLVTHGGASFMCNTSHFSTDDTEPDVQDNYEGDGTNWHLVSTGTEDPETFFDTVDNFFDWITDVGNWGVGDWIQAIGALALGAGAIWAGINLISAMSNDGDTDPSGNNFNPDQRYTSLNGSDGYNGAYTAPLLPQVITDLCILAGINYDVSELPNVEVNASLGQITTINNVIDQLALIYQFDRVESGSLIKFIPKDKASIKTLTESDVGYSNTDGEVPYTFKRFQGIDLPRAVKITYLSEENNYNNFTQETRFQNFTDGQDINLQVSMSIEDSKAKEITEVILKNAHLEQMNYGFSASYDQIELEPGDVIETSEGTMRITRIVEEDEGLINFLCTDASNNDIGYTVANVTPSIPDTQTNIEPSIGFSDAFFLDLPALNEADTEPRLHAAVHGFGKAGWTGASIYRSTNNGSTYDLVASTQNQATWGGVATLTPVITQWQVFDETTTITVVLKTGTLESVSDLDLFNGSNRCMIGGEMISFGTATLTGTLTYELTHLLRGRQGTELAIKDHVADEPFILIDSSLVELPFNLADRAKAVLYKIVTNGSSLDVTNVNTITPYGINLVPWAQTNPSAVHETNNDWTLSWTERYKWASDGLYDYKEVDKDSDWAGWTVAILDPLDVVVKTVAIQKSTFTYKEADQIIDFGSVQGTLKFKVFMMSRLVGGGYSDIYTA